MAQSSSGNAAANPSKAAGTWAMVAAEWLLVLPASVFLAAGVLRVLQPRQYQPARASWAIFEWAMAHISHLDAAVMFLLLPALVMSSGSVWLWRAWRGERTFREDATETLAILRRQLAGFCLAGATLAAAGILALAIDHLIVG